MKQFPTSEEIRDAVSAAFKRAVDRIGPQILGALIPYTNRPVPMIWSFLDSEADELCRFVNQFNEYLEKATDPRARTRLRVLIYCHIMEAELPPAIIWNLLRLLAGEQASWTFYRMSMKAKELACDEPDKRFKEIERLCESSDLQIGRILQRLWHNKLRNAFSHAQYVTSPEGSFLGGRNISPLTANAVRPSDMAGASGNPYYYTATEIEHLHVSALAWLSSISNCYRSALRPFKDGSVYELTYGKVRWDKDRHGWITE